MNSNLGEVRSILRDRPACGYRASDTIDDTATSAVITVVLFMALFRWAKETTIAGSDFFSLTLTGAYAR